MRRNGVQHIPWKWFGGQRRYKPDIVYPDLCVLSFVAARGELRLRGPLFYFARVLLHCFFTSVASVWVVDVFVLAYFFNVCDDFDVFGLGICISCASLRI